MIAFLKLLLGFASHITKLLADKQLISAGEAQAVAGTLKEMLHNVEQAARAARAVDPDDPMYDDDYAKRVRGDNERQ